MKKNWKQLKELKMMRFSELWIFVLAFLLFLMKKKFEEHVTKMPNKKTMKTCQNEKVNEAVFFWFTQQRDNKDGDSREQP